MRLAGGVGEVFLGDADDHRVDRPEAKRLESQGGECIVVVGPGGGRGAGQRVGLGEQHQQHLHRRLRGRLHHADDQPRQGSAYAVIVEAGDITRAMQAQQAAHYVVRALEVRGAALRQKRVETLPHLGARRDDRSPDHGVVQHMTHGPLTGNASARVERPVRPTRRRRKTDSNCRSPH